MFPSLVYPDFELEIEQDEIRKALLIKQETEWIEWFGSFLLIPCILELFSYEASIRRDAFIREGRKIQF